MSYGGRLFSVTNFEEQLTVCIQLLVFTGRGLWADVPQEDETFVNNLGCCIMYSFVSFCFNSFVAETCLYFSISEESTVSKTTI